jgi:carboxymethylenebutenolidase
MSEGAVIQTSDGSFSAYLARPARQVAPSVVVIQEIFGVNAVMRAIADQFAATGYLAICPDLFWRIEPGIDITDRTEPELKRAFELFAAFDVDKGVKDIAATIAHIRSDDGCSGKVGSVGFCLGGLLSFLTAARTNAEACVAYYGVGIEKRLAEAATLAKPVMLHIAGDDQFVPHAAQQAIIDALAGRPNFKIHSYPGLGHAFARRGGDHFDAAAAALADTRTREFLAEAL